MAGHPLARLLNPATRTADPVCRSVLVVTGSPRRGRMTFHEFAGTKLPALLRFAVVLTGDRGLAEDVVQEVLLRVHQRWHKIGELDSPEHYVRRMITNEDLSWRRRWRRVGPRADPPVRPDPVP